MTKGILSLVHENGIIDVPDDALVVGIDETGCEDYKDDNFPVFGIGGCAIVARDYFRFLENPWHEIKDNYFGGKQVALHASDLKNPSKEQLSALKDFFTKLPFFRFACMSANSFENQTEETNVHLLSKSVMDQVCEFVTLVQPSQIIFIIENSERIGKSLLMHFSAYRYSNGDIDFSPQVLMADKKTKATCVEVADFVVHPAGAQVRNRLKGFPNSNNIVRKDFEIVFYEIDNKFSSYRELLSAKPGTA